MWMVANITPENPVKDVTKFFRDVGSSLGVKLVTKQVRKREDCVDYCQLSVVNRKTKAVLLNGVVDTSDNMDPYCGKYALFECTSFEGFVLIEKIVASSKWGTIAVLEHSKVEFSDVAGPDTKLKVVTGEAPDDELEDQEEGVLCSTLATRFTLYQGEEEVARAHLSYRDGSFDPSFGPTIEMMAVKQSHRGQGLLKTLYHWVRCFIEENFTIECLNNDAPHDHIMVKVTQLTGTQIELRTSSKTDELISVSDKDFFFKHYGYSVREQKGAVAFMMGGRRPPDEEAVLYIPLLSRTDILARWTQTDHTAPASDGRLPKQHGAKVCELCRKIGKRDKDQWGGLLLCSRCSAAYYCSKECQKKDWKVHKLWCGKTDKQIHKTLVKQGRREKDENGNWTTTLGPLPDRES